MTLSFHPSLKRLFRSLTLSSFSPTPVVYICTLLLSLIPPSRNLPLPLFLFPHSLLPSLFCPLQLNISLSLSVSLFLFSVLERGGGKGLKCNVISNQLMGDLVTGTVKLPFCAHGMSPRDFSTTNKWT